MKLSSTFASRWRWIACAVCLSWKLCAQSTSGTKSDSIRAEYQRNANRILEDLRRADFLAERLETQKRQMATWLEQLNTETQKRQKCEQQLPVLVAAVHTAQEQQRQTRQKLLRRNLEVWAWRIGAAGVLWWRLKP